jgi:hypothetical protein
VSEQQQEKILDQLTHRGAIIGHKEEVQEDELEEEDDDDLEDAPNPWQGPFWINC